jgi:hypothetical protein
MRRFVTALLLAGLGAAVGIAEVESWLPPPVAEGVAQQLDGRLRRIGDGAAPANALELSRQAVDALRAELEDWGVDGIVERAPDLTRLGVPRAESPLLDAMARYQVCNMALMLTFEEPANGDDAELRRRASVGLTAVTMAILRLREPFHAAGGDDAAIESFLTRAEMEPVLQKLQADAEIRRQTERSCDPIVTPLIAEPLRRLGAPAPQP